MIGYEKCEKFANCMDYVYTEDVSQDRIEVLLYRYSQAIIDVRRWLHSVLCKEMSDEGYSSVSVSLNMPFETLTVKVDSEDVIKSVERPTYGYYKPEGMRKESPELLQTPIGTMDYYTYCKITFPQDNPVVRFYDHLGKLAKRMHALAKTEALLNAEILKESGVKDILQLYKMDSILKNIYHFFHEDSFWFFGSSMWSNDIWDGVAFTEEAGLVEEADVAEEADSMEEAVSKDEGYLSFRE